MQDRIKIRRQAVVNRAMRSEWVSVGTQVRTYLLNYGGSQSREHPRRCAITFVVWAEAVLALKQEVTRGNNTWRGISHQPHVHTEKFQGEVSLGHEQVSLHVKQTDKHNVHTYDHKNRIQEDM